MIKSCLCLHINKTTNPPSYQRQQQLQLQSTTRATAIPGEEVLLSHQERGVGGE